MPRLQIRRLDEGQLRDMTLASAKVVTIGETTIGLGTWEPGWQWSKHLKPMVGTESCPFHHLGYAMSGSLRVRMDDGETLDVPPGSAFEIPPGHDAWVLGDAPFVTVEWTSSREVGIPAGPSERVLATVLFTDIAGSTARLAEVGDAAWRDLLMQHNTRLRADLNAHLGREIDTTGDGLLATFSSATNAVRCGLAMVASAGELGLTIRVGIHTGEVEFVGGNARGVAVHAAARVMALADDRQVFVSSTTRDLLEGSGISLVSAGTHELKGLAGQRELFRVT
jgi:class 3 adenylate cyclase